MTGRHDLHRSTCAPYSFAVRERPIGACPDASRGSSARLGLDALLQELPDPLYDENAPYADGALRYELTDHLGNVCAVVSDALEGYSTDADPDAEEYHAELLSAQEYEPFGSLLPGRNYSSGSYRYLFQGQEHDDEINGATGTSYAFEYRIHDPRVGRFLSVDPLAWKFPYYSPYQFSSNSPIVAIELEGLETSYRLNFTEGSVEVINGQLRAADLVGFAQGHRWGFSYGGLPTTPSPGVQTNVLCLDCKTSYNQTTGTALIWIRPGMLAVPTTETVTRDVSTTETIVVPGTDPRPTTIPHEYTTEGVVNIDLKTRAKKPIAGKDWSKATTRSKYIAPMMDQLARLGVVGDVTSIEMTSYVDNADLIRELGDAIEATYGVRPTIAVGTSTKDYEVFSPARVRSSEAGFIPGTPDSSYERVTTRSITETRTVARPAIEPITP